MYRREVPACDLCGHDNPVGGSPCAGCGNGPVVERVVVTRNPPMPRRENRVPPLEPTPWRATLSDDPAEHELLVPLRANPADAGARMVYADWLEQHGEVARAWLVRHEGDVATPRPELGDAAWRAIASRAGIWRCHQEPCPKRWDLLEAREDDERTRSCTTCDWPVKYCVDGEAAFRVGANDRCPIALDASLELREGRLAFDRGLALPPSRPRNRERGS